MSRFDKHLTRKNAAMPKEHLAILEEGKEMPATAALQRGDINKLFDQGYLAGENGYCRMDNGSMHTAVLIKMPNVTIDMINWWFWWHAAESIRYRIWYPDMHFATEADFGGYSEDETKSYRERLHLSSHLVTEDVGLGKEKILINFMHPKDFGYDVNKLNDKETTIICAKVGSPERGLWHTHMCHFVRIVPSGGIEMRSRFWMGHHIEKMSGFGKGIVKSLMNTSFVKRNLLPTKAGSSMFHHCSQEYHNMGEFLPALYQEEGPKK